MPRRRPDEISAGGVLARPSASGWEVCLVRAGRYWGLPKGHIERGESAEQAALREISEECGVPIELAHRGGPPAVVGVRLPACRQARPSSWWSTSW